MLMSEREGGSRREAGESRLNPELNSGEALLQNVVPLNVVLNGKGYKVGAICFISNYTFYFGRS